MVKKLTNADYCRAAKKLKVEVAAIRAVADTESKGQGFYADGFPVILFERHKFKEFTKGKYNKTHPEISGPAGNYGKAGANQRRKFNIAFGLDPEAAMKSCSWGKFQIMGFNYKICGYSTVGDFVDAMKESEGKQLDAFCAFVQKNNLVRYIKTLNWAKFAEGYNGERYRDNDYDTKMSKAFLKYIKEPFDCGDAPKLVDKTVDSRPVTDPVEEEVVTSAPTSENGTEVRQTQTESTATGSVSQTVESKNEQDVNTPVDIEERKLYNGVGFWKTIKTDLGLAFGGNFTFQGISELMQQTQGWPAWVVPLIAKLAIVFAIFSVGYLLFRLFHFLVFEYRESQRIKGEILAKTDIARRDINWIKNTTV